MAFAGYVIAAKPNFSLTGSPTSQSVSAGQKATFTLTVARESKFTDPIVLTQTGAPTPSTPAFTPATIPATSTSATFTVQTAVNTPPGTYTINVTGTASKTKETVTATLSLTVTPVATPNFAISASPAARTVIADDTTTFTVTATRINGYSSAIALSMTGLPSDVSVSFAPASLSGATTTSTATVTAAGAAKDGTYPLTVVGTGAGSPALVRSSGVSLSVLA
jgi:hypothetical protein